ncbi:MAG: multidrug efflux SMR transporter [Gammaproteobacteria bacterium]|nr:multidrug efflux SMR transporter [Gammaproteobacteria bacterium]
MYAWLLLCVAIVLEVAGTTSMKLADGFTRPLPSVLLFVFYAASFVALTFALKRIEVSIAYAVWSGLGMALVAVLGVVVFDETLTVWKVLCIVLIMSGVVGLSLAGPR